MAQKRWGSRRQRALRRVGVVGTRGALAALLALSCVGAGVGFVSQTWSRPTPVARADQADVTAEAPTSEQEVPADGADAQQAGSEGQGNSDATAATSAQRSDVRFVVHVDGAVGSPGVVELEGADVRVRDAVDAAGGLTSDADTTGINLAEPLVDGAKIHVPVTGETEIMPAGQVAAGPVSAGSATTEGAGGGLVNLNTASAEELKTLPGIGEATAAAIIEERERGGPFTSVEDVMRVSGVGEKKYERLRELVCV